MRHHTVDIAGRDEKTETRTAVFAKGVTAFVVGLREDSHAIAGCLKHTRDDRDAKGRMIDVSVTRNVNKIRSIPAARHHIRARER